MESRASRGVAWLDGAMLAVCALAPVALAVLHVGNVADAVHDEGLLRTVGLGWTGALRALDTLAAAPLVLLPVGTRAARAALASALAAGAAGALLYRMARGLLGAERDAGPGALGLAIAAVASLSATLSWVWQSEAACVAGSTLGALLVIAPAALATWSRRSEAPSPPLGRSVGVVFTLALAVAYEPVVGLAAALAIVPAVWTPNGPRARLPRPAVLAAAVLGLATLGLGFACRRSPLSIVSPALSSFVGEGDPGAGVGAFLHGQVGWLGLALSAAGAGLALFVQRTRRRACSLLLVVALGVGATRIGVPFGASRFGAPVLAAVGALWVLAAVAMERLVRAVASARVPLAGASAAMIVVLEVTFPVLSADDTAQRFEGRAPSAERVWTDVAVGSLPARPIVLVRAPRLLTRLLAARAEGDLRADVSVVPLGDIVGPLAARELTLEPKLVPLWRDLLLTLAPDEWALSSLASTRALALPFEPRWERSMARHLVPAGLLGVFAPEPRGASDRARALDAFVADRDRLTQALRLPVPTAVTAEGTRKPSRRASTQPAATEDTLTRISAALLVDRALTLAAEGERELAARSLDDARRFEPTEGRADELSRRLSSASHGPVDVRDLVR